MLALYPSPGRRPPELWVPPSEANCPPTSAKAPSLPDSKSKDCRRRPSPARCVWTSHGQGYTAVVPISIEPGLQTVEVMVKVPHPEPWWPVGQGGQALYTATLTATAGATVIHRTTRRVGFRHLRPDQSPHPADGQRFVMVVNGRPVFAKGANWVPADIIVARIEQRRYAELIDRALELNFNFLRVWGGVPDMYGG